MNRAHECRDLEPVERAATPGEVRVLCIADHVGIKRDGGSMRLHELMSAVCAMGPSRLLLLNEIHDDAMAFVTESIGAPVTAIKAGVVPRWRAALSWFRHPSMPWGVARSDRANVSRHIDALLADLDPDLIWTTSVLGWLALPRVWRRRAAIDLIDGISSADSMMVRLTLRRWIRRGYWSVSRRPMRDAPKLPRVRDFLKQLDGAVRGPALERLLGRGAHALVVSHAANRRYQKMLIVPNGFDPTPRRPEGTFDETRFVFPANFRYEPNLDGAEWFVQSILPRLRREMRDPKVIFAGQIREGLETYGNDRGVDVIGPFESLSGLVDDKSVIIVPLLGGTGTRLKILEAWSMGLPVVSTTVGAEGLGAVDRQNILIADDASAFARACAELARSQDLRAQISRGALQSIEAFRWSAITEDLRCSMRQGIHRTAESA